MMRLFFEIRQGENWGFLTTAYEIRDGFYFFTDQKTGTKQSFAVSLYRGQQEVKT